LRGRQGLIEIGDQIILYQRNAQCYARGEHRGWEGEAYEREAQRWRQEAERQFAQLYGR